MKQLWQALMLVRRCDRPAFVRRVVYVVLQSVLPLLNLYLLKLLVDEVALAVGSGAGLSFDASRVGACLAAMCAVFLANRVVAALNAVNNDILGQRLVDHVSDLLQRQSARLDMQFYDNPSYHDTFHRAQQEANFRPLQILNNIMSLGGSLISIAVVVAMLVTASWWVMAVMVVAVLPGFAVRLYKARRIYRFRRENTQLYRRTAYYGAVLTARDFAKELRTYRLTDLFRGRFVDARRRLVGRLLSISRRLGALDVLCAVVEAAAMFAVVALLIAQAYKGAITIGSFVMLFEAFRRGQGYLSSLVGSVAGLYDNRLFVSNLFEFLDMEPTVVDPADPLPLPQTIERLELHDVTFRYPGMDRDVLCHCNFCARRGEVTRLEGENGRGKSTILMLLLRLYDPQRGSVTLNGIDLRRFRVADLRRRFGVLFQDFVRFQCTMDENIVFGDVDRRDADTRTAAALAGADRVRESLPHQGDTLLGRMFDGGQELSMGQWQRVALARALQADAPVLLLDEPAAWLDADGREHLMQSIDRLKRDRIVILVTHVDLKQEQHN